MASPRTADIEVMEHLFYDLAARNKKKLNQKKAGMLKALADSYKAVIDEIAVNPDSLLVMSKGWYGRCKCPELEAAWESVLQHAAKKMGQERVVPGGPLYRPNCLRESIVKFARGKEVRITDCGEYLGVCTHFAAKDIELGLKSKGINATHAASRLAGIRYPKTRYEPWRQPKPIIYTFPPQARKRRQTRK